MNRYKTKRNKKRSIKVGQEIKVLPDAFLNFEKCQTNCMSKFLKKKMWYDRQGDNSVL